MRRMETPEQPPAPRAQAGPSKAWWALAALMAAALVVDVIDGQPLKMLTSALLLVGCLLSAALPMPRGPKALLAIAACFGGALLLLLIRLVTGTL